MAGEAIFLGYRRDDTADVAGRIYDAMAQRFGRARVFKDVDNIGPGIDFGEYIKTVLPRCRVALVLIGPHWLESKDEAGRRRLDDDHDWVRIETETALATPGVLVVPVLVNGARMPRTDEMPDSLKPLLRRNAAIIRRDPDFHDDVERLATAIRSSVNTGIIDLTKIAGKPSASAPRMSERKSPMRLVIGGAIAAALALLALAVVSNWPPPQLEQNTKSQALAEPVQTVGDEVSDPSASTAHALQVGPADPPRTDADTAPPRQAQRQSTRPVREARDEVFEPAPNASIVGTWTGTSYYNLRQQTQNYWVILSDDGYGRDAYDNRGTNNIRWWRSGSTFYWKYLPSPYLPADVQRQNAYDYAATLENGTLSGYAYNELGEMWGSIQLSRQTQ